MPRGAGECRGNTVLAESLVADVFGVRATVTHTGPDDRPPIRFLDPLPEGP
ncbi:hypothetical protein [Streptomyces sp. DSM 40750]|uniref:hypothetical protein n=1 Tax=Streptomyces sp. DSM 40750 TaxID=2801030 RepID=UPI0027D4714E|nr:hypothetical protein [Streptomyces sp. DSM 40750]